jgi:hypothetical protein
VQAVTHGQLTWLLCLRDDPMPLRRYIPHPVTISSCEQFGWVTHREHRDGGSLWTLTQAGLEALEEFEAMEELNGQRRGVRRKGSGH